MVKNTNRQLLVETFTMSMPTPNLIQQSIMKNNGRLFLTGRLQFADKLNGNERYYPREILQRQIQKYQRKIKLGQAVGQCDHPDSDQISTKNIAFLIKQIHWQGNQVVGTIMLTSNSVGRDMQALVQDGVTLSISSRGMGSLRRTDKGDQVQDDFDLVGWDIVMQPSTTDASFWNNGGIKQNKSIDRKVSKLIQSKNKKVICQLSKQILSILN